MKKFMRMIGMVVEIFVIIVFSVVVILQTYNIVGRYTKIFLPFMWVEELTRYSFIWMAFLLWHLLDREDAHFVVNILPNKLSGRRKKYLELFINFTALFFSGVVVWTSIRYIPTAMMYPTCSFSWLPMGVVYMVIPVGLVLASIERLQIIASKITHNIKKTSTEEQR